MTRLEKRRVCDQLGGISVETYDELVRELVEMTREQVSAIRGSRCTQEQRALAHSIHGAAATLRMGSLEAAAWKVREAIVNRTGTVEIAAAQSVLEEVVAALEQELESPQA